MDYDVLEITDNLDNLNEIQKLIFNSAYRVYKELGPGHAESTYQKSLMYELNTYSLLVDIERNLNVTYTDSKNHKHIITSDRIDLFIHKNNKYKNLDIILELKAVQKSIQEQEIIQINKYVKQLQKENININFGIIINFPQASNKKISEKINFFIINYKL